MAEEKSGEGLNLPLLALKMEEEDLWSQRVRTASRIWEWPSSDSQQANTDFLSTAVWTESANHLSVHESRFSGVSRKEHSHADALILVHWNSCQTSYLQSCDNKFVLFEAAKFVLICYGGKRKLINPVRVESEKWSVFLPLLLVLLQFSHQEHSKMLQISYAHFIVKCLIPIGLTFSLCWELGMW